MSLTNASTPVSAVSQFLEHVDAVDGLLNAFAQLTPADILRREARESLERWRSGRQRSPLDGVLVSVKDNVARQGEPCRLGSAARSAEPAPHHAPAMAKLLAAGMIVVGRTTMPDHGCKGITHGGLHGTARSPWDPALTPGGSSGGAAASVAAGLTRVALGSDGGGSIRIPAAFCGIVGLKPTYGRVPVVPGGAFDSIGHQGPLGSSVADVAALLDIVSGESAAGLAPVVAGLDLSGLRFSVWADSPATDPAILEGVQRTAGVLADLGAVAVPWTTDLAPAKSAFEAVFCRGAAEAVQSFPDDAPMDPVLRRLSETGRALSDRDLLVAQERRAHVRTTVADLFDDIDILVSPVTECLPFEVEHEAPPGSGLTQFHEWAPWTYPFNLTGNPAISLPTGLSGSSLPVGVQLVAGLGKDGLLIHVAAQLEAVLGRLRPPSVVGRASATSRAS